MAAARPAIGIAALVILAGGILLQLLTVLSGSVNSSPINQLYFLEASTNGIANARNPSRWTFFAICGVADDGSGLDANCGKPVPALPFDPPRNFGTEQGVPEPFLGTHKFFYLSRFMFVLYLVALLFAAGALFAGMLAVFSRLGGYLAALTTSTALFFQTVAAVLMTVWIVQGRDAFRSAGQDAHVGVKLMAFTWAAMACFFVATALFFLGGRTGRDAYASSVSRKRSTRSTRSAKSNRSRGSFLDTESQGRLKKDDYS